MMAAISISNKDNPSTSNQGLSKRPPVGHDNTRLHDVFVFYRNLAENRRISIPQNVPQSMKIKIKISDQFNLTMIIQESHAGHTWTSVF